jgi:PAS domain S-box-containing protein
LPATPLSLRIKSGAIRECLISICSILVHGQRYFLSSIVDITELRRAEAALRTSETNFRVIFKSSSAAMTVVERDTTISMVNQEFCKLSLYDETELIGTNWTRLIHPADLDRVIDLNRKRLIDPKSAPDRYEFRFRRANGDMGHCILSIAELPVSRRFICSFVDITERKRAETERERLAEELLSRNQELEQILYTASHDLRTPMVTVQGFAGELRRSITELREFLAAATLSKPRVDTGMETTGQHGLTRILENPEPCSPVFIRGSEACSSVVSDTNRKTLNRLLNDDIPEFLDYVHVTR